ncbi:hypothetical protein LY28_00013 [Ruminiclostridium sufflavum DSM 19573]|uniref:Uncharacterized protein n=1 Tax=Ruminiclostridium sufflavum DSM 19573 TaxID=1121337 RepID=A0A318XTH1_9FIRM|nr:S-layer family protein [Ruminiclostridium sufflavum]PYG90133.1 hypothetical protein LY28_00013 [Ruminiclostridium sufflavum DSM 19573]
MYNIPDLYKSLFKTENRTLDAKIVINGIDYTGAEIVEFEIDDSICSGESLEIGSAISSILTCTIRTADVLAKNAKVQPYIRLGLDVEWKNANVEWMNANFNWEGEYSEWMPLGEFYIDGRKFSEGTWKFTCYDRLMMANQAYETTLEFPAAMDAVMNDICAQLGISRDSRLQINSGYMIPFNYDYTISEVIRYIASSHGACAKITKEGKLGFVKFNKDDAALESITPADYSNLSHDGEVKTITRIVVTYNDDGEYLEVGTGDESETLRFYNPFVTEAMLNTIFAALNGYSYKPYDMRWRCYPYLETGDRINVTYFETPAPVWSEVPIPWNTANFNWEGTASFSTLILNSRITFGGGLSGKLSAQAAAEQQAEFKGTLTRKVENLSKTTIKEDKPYYGVTVGRANGLNIKKSDGSSEVVLNSDQLTFKVGGVDKIYFDPVSGKYKFNGTLEAVDGVFSGTVYAENIDTSNAKIKTAQIEELHVGAGGNVTLDPTATISFGQVSGAESAVTTITNNTLSTTNVIAQNLKVNSANINGTLTADKIAGGTLSGVSFKTSSSISDSRTEIVPNGYYAEIKQYDTDNTNRLTLRTDDNGGKIRFYNEDGMLVNDISLSYDGLLINASNGNKIYIGNPSVITKIYGTFDTSGSATVKIGGSSSAIGFFGKDAIAKQSAALLNGSATLSDVIAKVNGIMNQLANYGLIEVS